MPLTKKTFSDFFNLIIGKFQINLPSVDPNIDGSLVKTVSVASAIAGYSLQDGLIDATNQAFWQTANDDFLELIGGYDKTTRNPASTAQGAVSVEGTLTTLIPAATVLTYLGINYSTQQNANVQSYSGSITLTYGTNGTVTATTTLAHTLATGLSVTITGATQTDYNGTYTVIVLSTTTFVYTITTGLVLTSDQGVYTANYAILNLQSATTGANTNIGAGSALTLSVVNVNSLAYVQYGNISGGADIENIEDYRARVGFAHSMTPGISTPAQLIYSCKKISGVTRVYVITAQNTGGQIIAPGQPGYVPQIGETVIYLLTDNDPSILPSQTVLDSAKNQIITDGQWPNFVPLVNLYVIAPILIQQNFTISGIVPNTATMQSAINTQLIVFFQENSDVSKAVSYNALISFMNQIQDPTTGTFLQKYALTNPLIDMPAINGAIYTVGTVTYI